MPVIFAHRSVYYKQHTARFFQASAYGLATWLVWIGYVALVRASMRLYSKGWIHVVATGWVQPNPDKNTNTQDVFTFGSLVYFLVGFTFSASNFLVAAGLLFVGGLAMQQLFRTVCYLTPDTLSAIACMGGLIMLFSMYVCMGGDG